MSNSIDSLGVVAVVPFYSQADNINLDSNYAYLRLAVTEMSRQSPDTAFIVFFPDAKYGAGSWKYTPDGFQSDRIKFVSWPYDTAMRSGIMAFDPVRWHTIDQTYAPSILLLNQPELGCFLQGGYKAAFARAGQPTLIAQHNYVIHESLPYPIDSLFARRWMQLGGSLASHAVVYNSQHARRMGDESFGELLNTGQMAALDTKSHVLRFGLVRGDEPTATATGQPPIILYNHRFEGYKRPEVTFAVLRDLRATHTFEVWATQTIKQVTHEYGIDRSIYEPQRADYLRRIAVPAINTINSAHETFCISILDSMTVGHIVVAPRGITFPELLPEGYPYLFSTIDEQRAMLDHILRTWPTEWERWGPVLAQHARDNFRIQDYAASYLALMRAQESLALAGRAKDKTREKITQFISRDRAGRYTPAELTKLFAAQYNLGEQAFPSRRIARELIARGWRPRFDNRTLYIVRE